MLIIKRKKIITVMLIVKNQNKILRINMDNVIILCRVALFTSGMGLILGSLVYSSYLMEYEPLNNIVLATCIFILFNKTNDNKLTKFGFSDVILAFFYCCSCVVIIFTSDFFSKGSMGIEGFIFITVSFTFLFILKILGKEKIQK